MNTFSYGLLSKCSYKYNAKQKHLECKNVLGQLEATLQTGMRNQKV